MDGSPSASEKESRSRRILMTDEIHKIDRGSPWEPSRGCLPDEIADERVADGMREWRRSAAELDDKNKE